MIKLRKNNELEEISAASMSDVAFLLLVFFMVTAVFFVKEGLNIQLPKKNSNPMTILRKDVYEIRVTPNSIGVKNLSFGTKDFQDVKELREFLKDLEIQGLGEKLAMIRTAGDTDYGRMLDVLSAVQMRGFEKVSVKRLEP